MIDYFLIVEFLFPCFYCEINVTLRLHISVLWSLIPGFMFHVKADQVERLWHIRKSIAEKWPSKHLLVFQTSRRRLEDMSSRRLQHLFSVTILRLPRRLEDVLEDEKLLRWRRLEDVLKTCLEDVLKTCLEDVLKTCLEDVLKTYPEDVFKTSWRQAKCLLMISASNKSKCVSNKTMFHKSISDRSKANPKCVT